MALTRNAFLPSGASMAIFAVAAMRQAFDVAYRFALAETRGGASPIIDHQAVSDALANAKGRIEAVRLLGHLRDALAYPLIEGSNGGVRRRQLHDLFRAPGYDPLAASGMS